jgi:hypothetical protein
MPKDKETTELTQAIKGRWWHYNCISQQQYNIKCIINSLRKKKEDDKAKLLSTLPLSPPSRCG